MKRPNLRKPVTLNKPTVRSEPIVPKITVEITGADAATRGAIESAIIRALQEIAPVTARSVAGLANGKLATAGPADVHFRTTAAIPICRI